ncbi:MAG: GntR family transcriptional regulator [Bacillota bacterium]
MSWFSVERGSQPIYLQVKNRIKEIICEGTLPPGTKIPSSRALTKAPGVRRISVAQDGG